jgi:hypothetical protein
VLRMYRELKRAGRQGSPSVSSADERADPSE